MLYVVSKKKNFFTTSRLVSDNKSFVPKWPCSIAPLCNMDKGFHCSGFQWWGHNWQKHSACHVHASNIGRHVISSHVCLWQPHSCCKCQKTSNNTWLWCSGNFWTKMHIGLDDQRPIFAKLEYVGWVEEILELNYGVLNIIVLLRN